MSTFVTKDQLELINGGYVSVEDKPVTNEEFIQAQEVAHYIVTLAEKAKGKDFVGKVADSKEDFIAEVKELVHGKKTVEFVASPKEPKQEITKKLKADALEFILYHEDVNEVNKINTFMQQFVVLKDFEDFGLFFEDGIVKLNKIYTVAEITEAVNSTIDLLK